MTSAPSTSATHPPLRFAGGPPNRPIETGLRFVLFLRAALRLVTMGSGGQQYHEAPRGPRKWQRVNNLHPDPICRRESSWNFSRLRGKVRAEWPRSLPRRRRPKVAGAAKLRPAAAAVAVVAAVAPSPAITTP